MSASEPTRYTLTELAGLAGVSPRTVRYYIAQGLLAPAPSAGPGAKYGDGQLARLRLVRRMQREHQPLAAIRQHLERLDDATILRMERSPTPEPAPSDSALDYIRRVIGVPAQPGGGLFNSMPGVPLAVRDGPAPSSEPPSPEPSRSQWERIVLAPDVELHVRRPLTRTQSKRVDRLITIGRELLEEDPS